MQPVLSVSNLEVDFRKDDQWLPIVRQVSFDIGAQETVAVVGESGSGKSVTALAVMRLLPADRVRIRGGIHLGERSLLSLDEERMRRIRGRDMAMVFQEPCLNPVFTIGFQLAEALRLRRPLSRREARREAIRLLKKVRIPAAENRYDDYPHQLSGGMRQRVMIALALAGQPKLLIADEPTTALDVTIQAQILALLKTLQREEGMAVLFITHDMGVVAEIADRTLVMQSGRSVEFNQTARLFAAPAHPYTQALLAAVPLPGQMDGVAHPLRYPDALGESGPAGDVAPARSTVDMSRPPLLEVQNLTTRFDIRRGLFSRLVGRVHAVEQVSFQLYAGETLSLVGESGCGKSTIARTLMGLTPPTGGTIVVQGRPVVSGESKRLAELRKSVQMVFQDPYASLNSRMTVGEAIAEPFLAHRLGDRRQALARVDELLTLVGLSAEMAGRYPHEFSGGQRQRICIARALILQPALLIADESVSALDVSVKAQIINLLLDLQARLGLAYLFISHDMAVVERFSHRVAVMYRGQIVETGPREAIFNQPRHPYTRRLMAAVPIPDPSRRQLIREIDNTEILSPIFPPDITVPPVRYDEVAPGHLVQQGY
ncbi:MULTISPECIES: ABC transporter ATP-binding protein [unclassified Brenneria]|uniref:ABC transporter ATP-binding protein n=1 Tax=unclassified Brenneria TaxID=2634434 RepID=UPI0029C4EA14|nr:MULTISPECIES: ABC transporter ATP-binding protein [unclassified Brenneria]MDX5630615.1 ABC transporter ATP-binding protein [Brenneria sp. L3-3Z]MDX5697760.1 ABC transporter ATP-binding protein [Brenneria sp. L4-2C]